MRPNTSGELYTWWDEGRESIIFELNFNLQTFKGILKFQQFIPCASEESLAPGGTYHKSAACFTWARGEIIRWWFCKAEKRTDTGVLLDFNLLLIQGGEERDKRNVLHTNYCTRHMLFRLKHPLQCSNLYPRTMPHVLIAELALIGSVCCAWSDFTDKSARKNTLLFFDGWTFVETKTKRNLLPPCYKIIKWPLNSLSLSRRAEEEESMLI